MILICPRPARGVGLRLAAGEGLESLTSFPNRSGCFGETMGELSMDESLRMKSVGLISAARLGSWLLTSCWEFAADFGLEVGPLLIDVKSATSSVGTSGAKNLAVAGDVFSAGLSASVLSFFSFFFRFSERSS